MTEQQGFDELFDEGLFRTSFHNSVRSGGRPDLWPRSVSEMRQFTDYGWQGMPADTNERLSKYSEKCPRDSRAAKRPPAPPSGQRVMDGRAWQWKDASSA